MARKGIRNMDKGISNAQLVGDSSSTNLRMNQESQILDSAPSSKIMKRRLFHTRASVSKRLETNEKVSTFEISPNKMDSMKS
jgi:hypothetical protein